MKKLFLFTTLLLLPLSTVSAQNDVQVQIDQLKTEIDAKQSELKDLKQSMLDEQSTIQFEHEELSFTIQIEVTAVENQTDYLEDTYVKLHTTVDNTTDEAVLFDPDWFSLYLVEVEQPGVFGPIDQLEKQAIPEKSTVEGVIYYNVTEAVSNAKDLLVRYQPSEDYSKGETVFEFKINDYKRIKTDEEVAQESTLKQTAQKEPMVNSEAAQSTELSQDEIYSAIEDAYYNDLQNDYYNAPETIYYEEQPEVWEDGPGYEEYWGPSTPQFEGQLSPEEMADLD